MDTIGLLKQTILNKKSTFAGKPFSTLVNDLPSSLPIKHYATSIFGLKSNHYATFGFIDVENFRRGSKQVIYLYVNWVNPPSDDREFEQWGKMPMGRWDQDDMNFYKSWIVKDIAVVVVGEGGYEVK
ncbi:MULTISPECIES: hypothetical protein [Chitinophagaceae]